MARLLIMTEPNTSVKLQCFLSEDCDELMYLENTGVFFFFQKKKTPAFSKYISFSQSSLEGSDNLLPPCLY